MEEHSPTQSQEEIDQLQRSVKKFKRPAEGAPVSPSRATSMEAEGWAGLFRQPEIPSEIYTGSDDEDEGTDDLLDKYDDAMVDCENGEDTGRMSIEISIEECRTLWKPWRRALIIKVLGKQISFRLLEKRLCDLWGMGSNLDIVDLDGGYFVVRFYSKTQYLYALECGPWTVQGHYITVTKWRPFFSTAGDTVTSTLAWVRIPNLPLEFFAEGILLGIGNLLGKAVKVDHTTMKVERGKYACICVEIDFKKPLASRINLNGKVFHVEYEGLKQICCKCGMYGHEMEECEVNKEVSGMNGQIAKSNEPLPSQPFGPWMIASSNRRRRSLQGRDMTETPRTSDSGAGVSVNRQGRADIGRSRFEVLGELQEEEVEEQHDDDLHRAFSYLEDKGPVVTFQVSTKETIGRNITR